MGLQKNVTTSFIKKCRKYNFLFFDDYPDLFPADYVDVAVSVVYFSAFLMMCACLLLYDKPDRSTRKQRRRYSVKLLPQISLIMS